MNFGVRTESVSKDKFWYQEESVSKEESLIKVKSWRKDTKDMKKLGWFGFEETRIKNQDRLGFEKL